MPTFRFRGLTSDGKTVQKEFEAESKKYAKKQLEKLARQKNIKVLSLEKKQLFQYKVRRNGQKKITGEQEAYSKGELEKALQNLGYQVDSIQSKLFNFQGSVSNSEVVSFVRLSADLLRQKLPYNEILSLLSEDIKNKRLTKAIRTIEKDLKEGKEGQEVYGKHKNIFGKFAAYMLAVASTSGNMAEVFESTAKFLERDAEFKKNLRRSMITPAITLLAVIATVLFYVGYIFPKTAEMFVEFNIELPPMTATTLGFSYFIQGNWPILLAAVLLPGAAFLFFVRTPKGKLWFDRIILKIPIIGDLMHKTSIEIFARVFYTLYSGSGQNVEVIRIAASACRNAYMERQIKSVSIPMMLKEGKGLVESLEAADVFTRTAIGRFRLGAESGAIRNNAKQLADYYELQTKYKMESTIESINLSINMIIMIVLIALTVVSSETAIIKPDNPLAM
ncbi:MAG TPA: type II secretion system F family protein [bacterium]|nr:type II secretion system F family protein [bacterium]